MLKGLARSGFGLIPACFFLTVNGHLFSKGLRKTYCGLFNHLHALRREGATWRVRSGRVFARLRPCTITPSRLRKRLRRVADC